MSTVKSSPAKLEAAEKAMEKYKSIIQAMHAKTAEEEEAMRAMDDTMERVKTLGIEGDCAAAEALIVEAEKRYFDAILETTTLFEESLKAQWAMRVACAVAGPKVYGHYYGCEDRAAERAAKRACTPRYAYDSD